MSGFVEHFGIWSLLPVFVAILLAVTLKRVIVALGAAILVAAFLINQFHPINSMVFAANTLVFNEASDKNHLIILAFTILVGSMVGILIRAGAAREFIHTLSFVIKGKKSAQLLAWFSGMLVFFDDYTNCIVVGNTMRPLTDKHKVSREKLAYIVDSTAAPVTTIAVISTWVAFQVSLIEKALKASGSDLNAYNFFIDSIGYNFYAWLTLLFVAAIILSGRDFGPMRTSEHLAGQRQFESDLHSAKKPTQMGIVTIFIVPIAMLIGVCIFDLWWSGSKGMPPEAAFFEILGNADSYMAMLKASGASLAAAIALTLITRQLTPFELFSAMWNGIHEIGGALLVLICAWALAAGVEDLGAAQYVTQALKGNIPPSLLPTAIFIIASVISFSTGTSFATMGILVPLVLPLAFSLTTDSTIHLASAASILGGAVFGDHCSPISDTTILSSTGSGCGLVEHFRTQIPYALFVAFISILFGTLPSGLGAPLWMSFALAILSMIVGIRLIGSLPSTSFGSPHAASSGATAETTL